MARDPVTWSSGQGIGGHRYAPQWQVQLHPEFRDQSRITSFLDEIQLVPNWESFAR